MIVAQEGLTFLPGRANSTSAPTERWRDVGQDRFRDMRVVIHTELVGDSQQQCVGRGDCLVLPELLDKHVRFRGIAPTEDRPIPFVDETKLVLVVTAVSEISTVPFIDQ